MGCGSSNDREVVKPGKRSDNQTVTNQKENNRQDDKIQDDEIQIQSLALASLSLNRVQSNVQVGGAEQQQNNSHQSKLPRKNPKPYDDEEEETIPVKIKEPTPDEQLRDTIIAQGRIRVQQLKQELGTNQICLIENFHDPARDQIQLVKDEAYMMRKQIEYFHIPRLPKKLQLMEKKDRLFLQHLNWNIIHEFVRQKKWELFNKAFLIVPDWYLYQGDDQPLKKGSFPNLKKQPSPFTKFIETAPLEIILAFQTNPNYQESLKMIYSKGIDGLFQSIILNKEVDIQSQLLSELFNSIREMINEETFKTAVNFVSRHDLIPLGAILERIRLQKIKNLSISCIEIIDCLNFYTTKPMMQTQMFPLQQEQQIVEKGCVQIAKLILQAEESLFELLTEKFNWIDWRNKMGTNNSLLMYCYRIGCYQKTKYILATYGTEMVVEPNENCSLCLLYHVIDLFEACMNNICKPGSKNSQDHEELKQNALRIIMNSFNVPRVQYFKQYAEHNNYTCLNRLFMIDGFSSSSINLQNTLQYLKSDKESLISVASAGLRTHSQNLFDLLDFENHSTQIFQIADSRRVENIHDWKIIRLFQNTTSQQLNDLNVEQSIQTFQLILLYILTKNELPQLDEQTVLSLFWLCDQVYKPLSISRLNKKLDRKRIKLQTIKINQVIRQILKEGQIQQLQEYLIENPNNLDETILRKIYLIILRFQWEKQLVQDHIILDPIKQIFKNVQPIFTINHFTVDDFERMFEWESSGLKLRLLNYVRGPMRKQINERLNDPSCNSPYFKHVAKALLQNSGIAFQLVAREDSYSLKGFPQLLMQTKYRSLLFDREDFRSLIGQVLQNKAFSNIWLLKDIFTKEFKTVNKIDQEAEQHELYGEAWISHLTHGFFDYFQGYFLKLRSRQSILSLRNPQFNDNDFQDQYNHHQEVCQFFIKQCLDASLDLKLINVNNQFQNNRLLNTLNLKNLLSVHPNILSTMQFTHHQILKNLGEQDAITFALHIIPLKLLYGHLRVSEKQKVYNLSMLKDFRILQALFRFSLSLGIRKQIIINQLTIFIINEQSIERFKESKCLEQIFQSCDCEVDLEQFKYADISKLLKHYLRIGYRKGVNYILLLVQRNKKYYSNDMIEMNTISLIDLYPEKELTKIIRTSIGIHYSVGLNEFQLRAFLEDTEDIIQEKDINKAIIYAAVYGLNKNVGLLLPKLKNPDIVFYAIDALSERLLIDQGIKSVVFEQNKNGEIIRDTMEFQKHQKNQAHGFTFTEIEQQKQVNNKQPGEKDQSRYKIKSLGGIEVQTDPKKRYTVSQLKKINEQQTKHLLNQEYQQLLKQLYQYQHREGVFSYLIFRKIDFVDTLSILIQKAKLFLTLVEHSIVNDAILKAVIFQSQNPELRQIIMQLNQWDLLIQLLVDFSLSPQNIVKLYEQSLLELMQFMVHSTLCREKIQEKVLLTIIEYYERKIHQGQKGYIKKYLINTVFLWEQNLHNLSQQKDIQDGLRKTFRLVAYALINDGLAEQYSAFITKYVQNVNISTINGSDQRLSSYLFQRQNQTYLLTLLNLKIIKLDVHYEEKSFQSANRSKLMEKFTQSPQARTTFQYILSLGLDQIIYQHPNIVPQILSLQDIQFAIVGRNYECLKFVLSKGQFDVPNLILQEQLLTAVVLQFNETKVVDFINTVMPLIPIEKFGDLIQHNNGFNLIGYFAFTSQLKAYGALIIDYLYKKLLSQNKGKMNTILTSLFHQSSLYFSMKRNRNDDLTNITLFEFCINTGFYVIVDSIQKFKIKLPEIQFESSMGFLKNKNATRYLSIQSLPQYVVDTFPLFNNQFRLYRAALPYLKFSFRGYEKIEKKKGKKRNLELVLSKTSEQRLQVGQFEAQCFLAPLYIEKETIPFISPVAYLINQLNTVGFPLDLQEMIDGVKYHLCDPAYIFFNLKMTGRLSKIDEYSLTQQKIIQSPIYKLFWNYPSTLKDLQEYDQQKLPREEEPEDVFFIKLVRLVEKCGSFDLEHPIFEFLVRFYPANFLLFQLDYEEQETEEFIPEVPNWLIVLRDFIIPNLRLFIIWIQSDINPKEILQILKRAQIPIDSKDVHFNRNLNLIKLLMLSYHCDNLETLRDQIDEMFQAQGMKDQTSYSKLHKLLIDYPIQKFRYGITQTLEAASSQILVLKASNYQCEIKGQVYTQFEKFSGMLALTKVMLCTFQIQETLNQLVKIYSELPLICDVKLKINLDLNQSPNISVRYSEDLIQIDFSPIHENEFYYASEEQFITLKNELVLKAKSLFVAKEQQYRLLPSIGYLENVTDVDDILNLHHHIQDGYRIGLDSDDTVVNEFAFEQGYDEDDLNAPHNEDGIVQERGSGKDEYFLQLLPDNNFQIVHLNTNQKEPELVLAEFYQFYPQTSQIVHKFLKEQEFKSQYSLLGCIHQIIKDLNDRYLMIMVKDPSLQQIWPYYLRGNILKYDRNLNRDEVYQKLRKMFEDFLKGIQREHDSQFRYCTSTRISLISFFTEIALKWGQRNLKQQQSGDVLSLVRKFLEWGTFQQVISGILHENLANQQNILKVVRGVYIDFVETQEAFQIEGSDLDKQVSFGKVQYLLQKYYLIIRIGVKHFDKHEPNIDASTYIDIITNQFSLYEQLLSSELLFQQLFKKVEIDRQMLEFSNQLSQRIKRTAIVSINHRSFQQYFVQQVISARSIADTKEQHRQLQNVFQLLGDLNRYFKVDAVAKLMEKIKDETYDFLFLNMFQGILTAIKDGVPASRRLTENYRKIDLKKKQNTQSIEMGMRLCAHLDAQKFDYTLGFQITLQHFFGNSVIGETYIIFWVKENEKGINLIQLASKNRPDTIAYINLEDRSWLEPASLRQRASQTYTKNGQQVDDVTNFNYPCFKSDEIQAVILLSKVWPRDNSLNQNILSVYFVDGKQVLYQITENEFKDKMCSIVSLEDEDLMQEELDRLYGNGKVMAGADINVCNLVPFLPSNIVFVFDDGAPPQLGSQDSYILQSSLIRGQSQIRQIQQEVSQVKIQLIDEYKFKVSDLQQRKLGVACFFEQNSGYKNMISDFKWNLNQFGKLFDSKNLDIIIIFDDAMDANPTLYVESFLAQNNSIFDNFIESLQNFVNIGCDYHTDLRHEIQYLNPQIQLQDNLQILPSMKSKLLFQHLKKIEFQLLIQDGSSNPDLVEMADGRLIARVIISKDLRSISLPSINQITALLYNSSVEFFQTNFNSKIPSVFDLKIYGFQLEIREHRDLELENVIQRILLIELIQYHAGIFIKHKGFEYGKITVIQNSNFNEDKTISYQEFDKPFFIVFGQRIDIYIFSDSDSNNFRYSDFICSLYRLGQDIDKSETLNNSKYQLEDFFVEENIKINIYNKSLKLNEYKSVIYSESFFVENQSPEITSSGISLKIDPCIPEQPLIFIVILGNSNDFVTPAYIKRKQGEGIIFNYLSQQSTDNQIFKSIVNQTLYLMIQDLQCSKDLKSQVSGNLIASSIIDNIEPDEKTRYSFQQTVQSLLRTDKKDSDLAEKKQFQLKSYWISDQIVLIGIYSSKPQNISLKSLRGGSSRMKTYQFQFYSESKLNLSRTTHRQVNGKAHFQKNDQKIDEKQIPLKYHKLFQMAFECSNKEVFNNNYFQTLEHCQHNDELQSNNFITMLGNNQSMNTTRVGELRRDLIIFRGNDDDEVQVDPSILKKFKYAFVHSVFPQIQYHITSENQTLEWTPTFKGVYNLFVDGNKVSTQLGFVVLAGDIDFGNSVIEFAEQDNYEFFSQVVAQAKYRDKYQNIIGDLEYFKYYGGAKLCDLKIEGLGQNQVTVSHQVISKLGHQLIHIGFTCDGADTQNEQQSDLLFMIQGKIKLQRHIKIKGVGFEQRQKSFVKELAASWKPSSFNVKIRRQNFYDDLLIIFENQDLKKTLSIVFQGEEGIDAGGLKREFYDLIGQTLKDQRYKLFAPVEGNADKYFIHPDVFRVKNRSNYFSVIGKLIANAIASDYLLGIDIITPFYKVLYGEKLIFTDLALILDNQSYQNQINLRNMNAVDLESLELNFQINQGRKMVDLIPNGENILVTQQNLDLYLDSYATYMIQTRYQELHDKFRQGFESVVNMSIFRKWLKPSEISIFTQGQLEIKYENLLNVISYSGVRGNNKVLFDTYLQQSETQILKNLLKFTTGSSSIPFDTSGFTVNVQFISGMDTKRLPISHTCFKSIEVPNYKTFDEMKRKLDVAFTVGIEGFGFA